MSTTLVEDPRFCCSADVMTVMSEDELDNMSAGTPEPAVLDPPVVPMAPPAPPSMQPLLHGEAVMLAPCSVGLLKGRDTALASI